MPTEALKTGSIINLDASPIVANTTGEGAIGNLRVNNDLVTTTAGILVASTYRLLRVPTDIKLKRLLYRSLNAPGAGAVDIGVAFSDSLTDGTQLSFATLANPMVQVTGPVDNKMFAAALTVPATGTLTDITFNGTFTAAMKNLPLWQALVNLGATQFTTDPGGFFDFMFLVTTAITNSVQIQLEAQYVE